MKISTIVDTNIFIDILSPFNAGTLEWSVNHLEHSSKVGTIVLTAVVWAELASPRFGEADLARRLEWLKPRREDFPFEAAYPAGRAHQLYRQRGGRRERTLPDFLIGAHAMVAGHRLLTRDASRYRAYFPDLHIICPETHP